MKRLVIAVALVVLIVLPSSPARAQDQGSYESALTDLHKLLGNKYPCFRMKKIDWEAVGRELLPKAKEVKNDEAFGLLCMQMVARLEDSHAVLQPGRATLPRPALPSWDGGFACLIDERDRPVVYWIDPNGPAAGSGLKVGSVVVSVNGKNAANAVSDMMKLLGTWYGFSSDRILQYDAARWLGRQMNKEDAIKLDIEEPDGAKRAVEIRATAQTSYIPRLPVPIAGIPDSKSISFTKLAENIGYLRVRRISNDLEKGIDAALSGMGEVKGLVIDVRGNSGGGFDMQSAIRNFNLEDAREPTRPRHTGKIAVLIDERCISAGEGWTSWFVASKKAKLFGTATAGASSRKETHTLSNGLYKVVVPVKAYAGFLDRPIERRGLEPDVPVRCKAEDLAKGRDTVLETAQAHLMEEIK